MIFVVNEGGRSGIAAINFTGNNAISSWSLKSIIKTHESSWLSWLLCDDNYTQEQLEQDRVLIQQYYANHGYPDYASHLQTTLGFFPLFPITIWVLEPLIALVSGHNEIWSATCIRLSRIVWFSPFSSCMT